ncbi:MAG: MBL fold metallo-hydrolase [Asgard group archaeon]|nr:MBL fold metallo-hydrolase [Asgard group archaeon]
MELEVVRGGGMSSNSFILSDENEGKIFIIDLGLTGKLTRFPLKKSLKKIVGEKYEDYELEVFLTHSHLDHIWGDNNLKDFQKVTYSASELAAKHINTRDEITLLSKYRAKISFTVDRIYADEDVIKFADSELKIIYTPGHTDGSAVLYESNTKSLFAGDVVFAGGACGRVDFPTGDRWEMIATLDKLSKLDIEHLYSGHGPDLHQKVRENILTAKNMMEYW